MFNDSGVRPRKQQRETLSITQLAAIRKIQRLDYFLSACSNRISRRVMEVMDQVVKPEDRVEAARLVLTGERQAGRDSDWVRACLKSLEHDDEKELAG